MTVYVYVFKGLLLMIYCRDHQNTSAEKSRLQKLAVHRAASQVFIAPLLHNLSIFSMLYHLKYFVLKIHLQF